MEHHATGAEPEEGRAEPLGEPLAAPPAEPEEERPEPDEVSSDEAVETPDGGDSAEAPLTARQDLLLAVDRVVEGLKEPGFLQLSDAALRRVEFVTRHLRRLLLIGTIVVVLPLGGYLALYLAEDPVFRDQNGGVAAVALTTLIVVGLLGLLVLVCLGLVLAAARSEERERANERQVEQAARRLRENMELPAIVEFNRVLLDQYHDIATRQANKSFRSGLLAMGAGLVVILVGTGLTVTLDRTSDQLVVGGVAAVGTALSGYLGSTYIAVYKQALAQMNHYFSQPVLNGYFLTAERIAEKLEAGDQREQALRQIVTSVLDSGSRMQAAGEALRGHTVAEPAPAAPAAANVTRRSRGRRARIPRQQ